METDGKANVVVAFLGSIAIITSHRYESQQFYFAVFDFVLKIWIRNCTFQQEPSGIKNILFLIFLLTLKKKCHAQCLYKMNKYSAAHLVEQEIASKQTRGKAGCKSIMYFSSSAAFGQQNISQ